MWSGMAALAAGPLLLCALAVAQVGAELPGSDRRSAVERWAPASADVILFERLRTMPREMKPVYLAGAGGGGTSVIVESQLELRSNEPESVMALLSGTAVGGQFVAEVGFDRDDAAGLVLVREKGVDVVTDGKLEKKGVPDPQNYTAICVSTDANGLVTVSVHDRENGQADVLDSRFLAPGASTQPAATEPATTQAALPPMDAAYRARFSTALAGQYSVPVKKTSGRLRIFRDHFSGMLRFYYEIRPEILGEACTGFLELQPSPEWDNYQGTYYVGPAIRTHGAPAAVRFHDLRVYRTSRADRDDRTTGFKVTKRDYNFSGTSAEGLVVSFGRTFPFRDADRKLVFWSAANYMPFWHLGDQLGLTYGSIEVQGDAKSGVFGPMSDRLLRCSRAIVTRDNAVRKRITWNYTLLNPDYVPWGGKPGDTRLPDVEEIWTVYPDGLILREQKYYAAGDGAAGGQGNRIAAMASIIGARSRPGDLLAEDAITITGASGRETKLKWPGEAGDFADPTLKETAGVVTARFAADDAPDAFLAYSRDRRFSGVAPLELSSTGQRNGWRMFCHFPANGQPYETPEGTQATMPGQITLGELIRLGATRPTESATDLLTDRDGRRYRRWITLLGLQKKGDPAATTRRVACWLYGANVSDPRGCRYVGYDPLTMEYQISVDAGRGDCSFDMKPTTKVQTIIRPLIRIEGWGERVPEVQMTGIPLRPGEDMEAAVEGGELIIWINREIKSLTKITLVGK